MKYRAIFDRSESARRLEAILLLSSGVGVVTAVLIFSKYGLIPGIAVMLLGVALFALARLFDLVAEILSIVGRIEEGGKGAAKQNTGDTPK